MILISISHFLPFQSITNVFHILNFRFVKIEIKSYAKFLKRYKVTVAKITD